MKNSCLQKYEDMNLLRETNKTQKHNFEKKFMSFIIQSSFCLKNKQTEKVYWISLNHDLKQMKKIKGLKANADSANSFHLANS